MTYFVHTMYRFLYIHYCMYICIILYMCIYTYTYSLLRKIEILIGQCFAFKEPEFEVKHSRTLLFLWGLLLFLLICLYVIPGRIYQGVSSFPLCHVICYYGYFKKCLDLKQYMWHIKHNKCYPQQNEYTYVLNLITPYKIAF